MKLAFWKRKKEEEPVPEPPQPALSVFVCGNCAPPALPEGCEAVAADGEPRGKYIFFAEEEEPFPADAEELLAQLAEHSEDILLFRTEAKGEKPDAENIFRQGIAPRQIRFAVSLRLFNSLPADLRAACRGERLAALLLLAGSSAALDLVCKAPPSAIADAEKAAGSLRAFILFFGNIKARLDGEKYRFAFAYACNRIIGTYAELAAENKAEELRLFDDFLKEENMALRVAAKERSAIVRQLMHRNFRAPLLLRPLCAAAAAKDRARR